MPPNEQSIRAEMLSEAEKLQLQSDIFAAVEADDRKHGIIGSRNQPERPLKVGWLNAKSPFIGGEYYRATRPAAICSHQLGWDCYVSQIVGAVANSDRVFIQTPNERVVDPDVLVIRPIQGENQGISMPEVVAKAQKAGQIVIADLDDDVWAHEDWPEDDRPNDDHYEDWCYQADAWLVSTPYLRDRVEAKLSAHVHRGSTRSLITGVYVAPNCYDPVGMGHDSHPVAGRRLGTRMWLSGRMTPDLEMYQEYVAPLLEEFDCQWVHIGHETGIVDKPGSHQRSFLDYGFPRDRLIELPSVTLLEMGRWLGATVSVGVICLADHPFNHAKTETHAFELAAAGLPLIAISNLDIYNGVPGRIWENEDTALTIRGRLQSLLQPEIWKMRSDESRQWAQNIAVASQEAYLKAIKEAVLNTVRK